MTGYHVGAVLTALLALVLVGPLGWRAMFVVGGVLGLLTLPVMWARLPESETYLRAVADRDAGGAERTARQVADDPEVQRVAKPRPRTSSERKPLSSPQKITPFSALARAAIAGYSRRSQRRTAAGSCS